ncbi:MAG TPA: cytochrome P460 family protein [Rhizomicrobium sp.]|nr:cytochrome P460 family protein [Rhizomicrobium sp.]
MGKITMGAAMAMLLAGTAWAQTTLNYSPDGKMLRPENYRSWVFLSSGFDMSYTDSGEAKAHVFNNVFVNRESYEAFQKSGQWPDKTVLVLETRAGSNDDPVLKRGQFQAGMPNRIETHVKDAAKGGWGFYIFANGASSAAVQPQTATCYGCHADNARTDTTFTQFYPELAARLSK